MSQTPPLKLGEAAPPISATATAGEPFDLSAHRGEYVVVYFFPRAFTPG